MRRAILSLILCCGLSAAAAAQPQIFDQRYQMGRTQVDSGQFSQAVESFKAALAAVPAGQVPDPNIYVALGYAEMRLGRLKEADSTFSLAQSQSAKLTTTSRQQLLVNREVLRKLSGR